jgi:hypothetical protein
VQEIVAQALILGTYLTFEAWLLSRRYRILDHGRVRRAFRTEVEREGEQGPLLICANHLTLIDSLFIQWAIAPGWELFGRPRLFGWNVPDKRNISKYVWTRVAGYLSKCIPIVRNGPPDEARRTLDKVAWLLNRGQTVVIFPEGGRTRIGKVDTTNFSYGVGRILQDVPSARVVCMFLRGVGQRAYSNYPKPGEQFFVRVKRIAPRTTLQGMRGARDLATQIVRQLSEMEAEYFELAIADR